ncbi:MAG TPA: LD-carboxypeptidase [Thermoleophilia bacterium]|nr:LD-carboxypeptidase [Thermoleophilia bacterium]
MIWRRPPALARGELVGVCAPSGPVAPERLQQGVAELRGLGFDVRVPEGLLERERFTAGSPERRRAELLSLFDDAEVRAVFCARGGAGAVQLLPGLDFRRLAATPKLFIGYSDVGFLQLGFAVHGLVTLHGPMVARDLSTRAYDRDSLWHALTGEGPPYASQEDELMPLRAGAGEGRLLGGCLSILAAAAGTPWALRCQEPSILLLEDVDEPPYRIDRMLRQLRFSGAFENVAGVVFGDMKGCTPPIDADFALEDVILDALAGVEVPIALGLSSGHTSSPNLTLPLGVRARLRCDAAAAFEVLEPAVG